MEKLFRKLFETFGPSAMGRRVALLLEGSRGDAQPYVAAALALKAAGYEILIIGDEDVADLAKPLGLFCSQGKNHLIIFSLDLS